MEALSWEQFIAIVSVLGLSPVIAIILLMHTGKRLEGLSGSVVELTSAQVASNEIQRTQANATRDFATALRELGASIDRYGRRDA